MFKDSGWRREDSMHARAIPYKYLALFYAVLIFLVSAIPTAAPTLQFQFSDKILHFVEYSVFSLLLFLTFFTWGKDFLRKHVFLLSSFIGIAYGLSDELHQKLVPGRTCDVFDFLADCLGVILIQVGIMLYLKRKEKRTAAI
jgi:VanZ family protein